MSDAEQELVNHRWRWRRAETPSRWYTVEYDANSLAWLVSDDQDRMCLEPGMQIDIARLALHRPIVEVQQAPKKKQARKRRRRNPDFGRGMGSDEVLR